MECWVMHLNKPKYFEINCILYMLTVQGKKIHCYRSKVWGQYAFFLNKLILQLSKKAFMDYIRMHNGLIWFYTRLRYMIKNTLLPFKSLGSVRFCPPKQLILQFSKNALNWSKVKVKSDNYNFTTVPISNKCSSFELSIYQGILKKCLFPKTY